jgi:sulfur transfer complex TusBCD TusB component (DsrH family)
MEGGVHHSPETHCIQAPSVTVLAPVEDVYARGRVCIQAPTVTVLAPVEDVYARGRVYKPPQLLC